MSTTAVPPTAPPSAGVRRLGWPELAVVTLGWIGASIAATWALLACVATPPIAVVVAVQVLVNVAVLALALAVRVRSLAPLPLGLPGRRWVLAGLAAAVGLKLVTIPVVMAWQALTGDTTNPQQFLLDGVTGGGAGLVAMLVLGGLLIPVTEELLFRGVAYGALRRYGPVVAGLGSAAVFALIHVAPLVMIVAFLLGVVNAALVERSGSIWPGVVAHATVNTTSFALAALLS